MPRSFNGKLTVMAGGTLVNTLTDGRQVSVSHDPADYGQNLLDGIVLDKANRIWESKGRVIASAASEDIDVYDFGSIDIGAGAGLDALGQALALAKIVLVLIRNRATSVGTLLVGGKATTAAWNSPFNADDDALTPVLPGGVLLWYAPSLAGYAVADTTNHLLKMAASGGDVTYDITIIGRTAS